MACIDCSDCRIVSPEVPKCLEDLTVVTTPDSGLISSPAIIRVEKISNGVRTEYLTTTNGDGVASFHLDNFDLDESFWQPGQFKLTLVNRSFNTNATFTQGSETATCLLFTLSEESANVAGVVDLVW